MAIPPQYRDFNHWVAQALSDLSKANTKWGVYDEGWSYLNATQHTQIKTACVNSLNAGIAELQAMVVHINSVPS